jgi:hypothetical protein
MMNLINIKEFANKIVGFLLKLTGDELYSSINNKYLNKKTRKYLPGFFI